MGRTQGSKGSSRLGTTGPVRRPDDGPGREIGGIAALGFSIFLVAALASLQLGDGRLMGPFGRAVAVAGYALLGVCTYLAACAGAVAAVRLLIGRRPVAPIYMVAGIGLGLLSLATLLHLALTGYRVDTYGPGGRLGEHLAEVLRGLISTAGTALLAAVGLVCAVVIATPLRMRQLFGALTWIGGHAGRALRWLGGALWAAARAFFRFWGEVVRAVLPERDGDEYPEEDDEEDADDDEIDEREDPAFVSPPPIFAGRKKLIEAAPAEELGGDTEKMDDAQVAAVIAPARKERKKKEAAAEPALATLPGLPEPPPPAPLPLPPAEPAPTATGGEPVIVESQFQHKKAAELQERERAAGAARTGQLPAGATYQLPPSDLLRYDDTQAGGIDRAAMLELSARLTKTLADYGVKGEVTAIRPGPVVTMYEFAPAAGTRVSKIANLTDDLAMALEALRVRIVAPIPGKAVVGIEVPNKSRETVYLKEIIVDDVFQKAKSKLTMALGKDIEGAPVAVDLGKMPHLLVAGTTGSGKSVSVNSMITSLLYNATAEDVRFIMVDPKMLELSIYEGIPHLLLPVVTDPKKANLALRWAVEEMERRYDLLATMGVRDLASFNKKVARMATKQKVDELSRQLDDDDEPVEVTEERGGQMTLPGWDEPLQKLPYIVVVIDEFADLMMCAPKEVETSVARIAQKARAAGIHLILATQRPSVDVITGLIKANFPSRIAFHVSSKVDARTILDQGGAESLLGAGDMLFSDRGATLKRIHGCFIDEDEIRGIVDFLKTQGKPIYNLEILRPRDEDGDGDGEIDDGPADEMYDRAVALVSETRQASISMIQRRLRVGYNRAARMVERMEREGVVGPPDGTNRREVLISPAA